MKFFDERCLGFVLMSLWSPIFYHLVHDVLADRRAVEYQGYVIPFLQ
jgi:hypothetical protein